MRYFNILTACVIFLSAIREGHTAINLEAVYLSATLPHAQDGIPSAYDGDDKIYFFATRPDYKGIVSFTFSTETINIVGTLNGWNHFGGFLEKDDAGNYYYLGGGINYDDVYKWDVTANTTTWLKSYDRSLGNAGIRGNGNVVHALGRPASAHVLTFNMTSERFSSRYVESHVDGPGVRIGDTVYAFARNKIVKIDLNTWIVQEICPEAGLEWDEIRGAVAVGKSIYVFETMNSVFLTYGRVFKFHPETCSVFNVTIENYPRRGYGFADLPTITYIAKLGRIYFFGGAIAKGAASVETVNDIFSIDVTDDIPAVGPDNDIRTNLGHS